MRFRLTRFARRINLLWPLVLLFVIAAPCVAGAAPNRDAEPVGRTEIAAEIAVKEQRLQAFMRTERLRAVLLARPANIAWMTAGLVEPTGEGPLGRSAVMLLITNDGGRFVIGPTAEVRQVTTEALAGLAFEARPYRWFDETALQTVTDTGGRGLVGADLPFETTRLVAASVARLRFALTESEVKKLRWNGRAAAEAIEEVGRALGPSMSERDVAERLTTALLQRGLRCMAMSVTADDRLALAPTAPPTATRFKKLLRVSVRVRRWGLEAAMTRLAAVGPVTPDLERRIRAAAFVNAQLQEAARPLVSSRVLMQRLMGWLGEVGCGDAWERNPQGGAIGYDGFDWLLRSDLDETVAAAQAFAWMPTLEGVAVGDTTIAFIDRTENVTLTPAWPAIQTVVGKQTYVSAGILLVGAPRSPAPPPPPR